MKGTKTYIAAMMKHRHCVAYTVFEGKIAVTGGKFCELFGHNRYYYYYTAGLKSVEAYCSHENKWSQFPDLLRERCDHGSVSMGNKLFVIGRYTSEVFDSITNKFMYLKSVPKLTDKEYYPMGNHAVLIGYQIYVFQDISQPVHVEKIKREVTMFHYDVKENTWFSGSILKLQKNYEQCSCAKMLIN